MNYGNLNLCWKLACAGRAEKSPWFGQYHGDHIIEFVGTTEEIILKVFIGNEDLL